MEPTTTAAPRGASRRTHVELRNRLASSMSHANSFPLHEKLGYGFILLLFEHSTFLHQNISFQVKDLCRHVPQAVLEELVEVE